MSTEPASDEFAFELMKLLLQVAWADDEIAPEEADALLAFGKRKLTPSQLQTIAACLAGKAPLPPPNFSLLKARRVEVLGAVKNLLTSDLRIASGEEAILAQISTLLR